MNTPRHDTDCPRTDAVLALHLDGDVGGPLRAEESGYEFVLPEAVAEHLQDCAPCQTALRRARRLDAALAGAAGGAVASHDLDALAARWFAAATATASAPAGSARTVDPLAESRPDRWSAAPAAAPRPPRARRRTLAFAAGFAVFGALATLVPLAEAIGRAHDRAHHEVHGTLGAAIGAAPIRPPAHVPPAGAMPTAATPGTTRPAPTRSRRPTPTADEWLAHFADAGQAAALRQLAVRHVVAAIDRGAGGDLLQRFTEQLCTIAPQAGGAAADADVREDASAEALALAGRSRRFVAHLAADLQRLDSGRTPTAAELAALAVATWIGNRELDAGIVRAVRRAPELTSAVAAALRADRRAAGGASLALDCWHALATTGGLADEAGAAAAWFAGSPARHFAELVAEYSVARDATRRQRILFALGCAADGSTVQPLLLHLASRRREEALAAAYALAQLPHRDLRPLVPAAQRDPDAWLLRAALLHAGLLAPQLRSVELTVHGEPAAPSFARFVPFALRCRDGLPDGRAARGDADGIGTGG